MKRNIEMAADHEVLDHPMTIARLLTGAMLVALLLVLAAAMPARTVAKALPRGVAEECDSPACLSPDQIVSAAQVRRIKHDLGRHALIVDIRAAAEAPAAIAMASDVRAPFMDDAQAQFRIDFGDKVDDALRAAHMGHDEPVILVSPSLDRAVPAALLLQERGYSRIMVLRY